MPLDSNSVLTISDQADSVPESSSSARAMSLAAAIAADDRKAEDIVILGVGEVSVLAEYFVIATGYSKAQVRAIASSMREKILEEFHREPIHCSGDAEASWVLHDYGDVILHIMMPEARKFYGLEAFWGHAPRFTLKDA